MTDTITTVYGEALASMRTGPKPLQRRVDAVCDDDPDLATSEPLVKHLRSTGPDDALRHTFGRALADWDYAAADSPWADNSPPNTDERRAAVLDRLGIDGEARAVFTELFPVYRAEPTTVIADDWEEWRTPERTIERDFYWSHYKQYLLDKGWPEDAVASLNEATDHVARRLSDPTRTVAYQAKGIVVGHVQSGKTANFTGVAAKAIDAGYRLVIVLTGTTNMLRAQTQRRMDMELTGRENLEREISAFEQKEHDYQTDPDWINNNFVRHGGQPSATDHPDIHRLTTHGSDYNARIRPSTATLAFERRDKTRPLHDPANLFTSNARLVVAKKNPQALRDLVADLGRIHDQLGQVPVLIIDDESDQASVNTTTYKKWSQGSRERKTINRLICQLLAIMPRAQYVGYTATPYANLFIDPSDVEDLFPGDFLISLRRPSGYMGPADFHDLDPATFASDDEDPATSNVAAHVRFLSDESADDELARAIDMYVLTGAVKLYRERHGIKPYRHHTMMVHEAMQRATMADAAKLIDNLWHKAAGYRTAAALARLRSLYTADVLPVSLARAGDLVTPEDFDELLPDIAEAVRRIMPADRNGSPVIVVNSDPDLERNQEALDFDRRPVWRILVGGNKLARGFTVEGLTVTYYRRTAAQVDTLMQMGRWFGFRSNYRDLVRLYTTNDLHDMFAAAYLDEEFLRNELRRYAGTSANGERMITPRQVPPLIAQHRPDLRPAARNKMWNARLVRKANPGEPMEPVAHPSAPKTIRSNTEHWKPILALATDTRRFAVAGAKRTTTIYDARVAEADNDQMLSILEKLDWLVAGTLEPELNWLRGLRPDQLNRWVVLFPQQVNTRTQRTLFGHGPFSIFERTRTTTGAFGVFSESRHRAAAYRIAGILPDPDGETRDLAGPATAAIIVYPTVQKLAGISDRAIDEGEVTLGFHIITPKSSIPDDGKLLTWTTRDKRNPYAITVPVDHPEGGLPGRTRHYVPPQVRTM
jgi:hypothetical protein